MVTVFDKKVMPHIAEADQTPAVRLLMAFIEQQQETIQQQQSEIEAIEQQFFCKFDFPSVRSSWPVALPAGNIKAKPYGCSQKAARSLDLPICQR